ncbi:MAG: TIGR02117 family protein [Bacteroidales bacterium]|nr:TIGR02117 family protein [Bacteroidales bacterium]
MKRTFRRIFKITVIIIGSLLVFVLLYSGSAYCFSRITVNRNPEAGEYTTIYILTNGVHTDIVVPVRSDVIDWSDIIKYEHTAGKDSTADYVAFGWGDKGFYLDTPTWADLRFPVAFRAAFALSTSAMHVTFYRYLKESDDCKSIRISREQYEKLTAYILKSFQRNDSGNVINIETNANYGTNDAFYEAIGRYNLFFTCNTWANNALKSCQQKASLWTAFDTGIFYHYTKQ